MKDITNGETQDDDEDQGRIRHGSMAPGGGYPC